MLKNSETKEQKTIKFSHPWRVFLFEISMFLFALIFCILNSIQLRKFVQPKVENLPPITFWQFLFWFFIITALLLSVIYFFKFKKEKKIILRFLFLFSILLGDFLFFSFWFPLGTTVLLTFFLIFLLVKTQSLLVHNFSFLLACSAFGAILGMRVTPQTVIFLFLVFSIYDFIAVFKTKHMVKIAKEMVFQKAILGIVVPQKISGFSSSLTEVSPGGKFLILGGGDIIFPLMFVACLVPFGIGKALLVGLFSVLGVVVGFLIFVLQKTRRPLPALPPIALFSIIGYMVSQL